MTLLGIATDFKLGHFSKACDQMAVTLSEINMELKLLQPENVYSSIRLIPLGSAIEVKLLQLANADLPRLVTLFGIEMEVKLLQP